MVMPTKQEIRFLEARLHDYIITRTALKDLKELQTLCDSEEYSHKIIIGHLEDLLKNWTDRTERASFQSELGIKLFKESG